MELNNNQNKKKSISRIWCDGCFDMVHFGHANLMRQAKQLGDTIVVGVHSDEEITKHKGPPVFTQSERFKMISAIKWVDEVVQEEVPFITTVELLDKYNCEFCVHGNDLSLSCIDGTDTYQTVKDINRMKIVERCAGISTTDLINRILKHSNNDDNRVNDLPCEASPKQSDNGDNNNNNRHSPYTGSNDFLLTTEKILQFCDKGNRPPFSNIKKDKIIYVAGAFDLFHVGHVDFLQMAKENAGGNDGGYLIVGLHSDEVVKDNYMEHKYPIMNLNERLLNLLSCKYVDEVVIGAPYIINENLMKHFNVTEVFHGKISYEQHKSAYAYPMGINKFMELDSGNSMTTEHIFSRIIEHRQKYAKRNVDKELNELNAIEKAEHSSEI